MRATDAEALTTQGEPVLDLCVPLNGTVEVRVGGAVASTLPPYQLVGEASLLENLQSAGGEVHPAARATVVALPGSCYVRWPQAAFYELQQEEDSDFGYAIQLMIARTLSQKLSAARLSQSNAEERLRSRRASRFRAASPDSLAARRRAARAVETDEAAADIGAATGLAGLGIAASRSATSLGAGGAVGAAVGAAVGERAALGEGATGGAAEVGALLKQNADKEEKLRRLERSLADARREASDLKLILTFLLTLGLVQVAASVTVASVSANDLRL